jgi:hypothetical protein
VPSRKLKRLGWDTIEITYDDVTTRRQATGRALRELYELRRSAVARGGALPTVTGGSDVPIGH